MDGVKKVDALSPSHSPVFILLPIGNLVTLRPQALPIAPRSGNGCLVTAIKQNCGAGESRYLSNGGPFDKKSYRRVVGIIRLCRQPDRLFVRHAVGLRAVS
jgi:hypothetical protein